MAQDKHDDPESWGCWLPAASALGFVWVLGYQCYRWLRDGQWLVITMGDFSPPPSVEWIGLQKIVDGIYGVDLWIIFLCAILPLYWLGAVAESALNGLRRST